MIQTLISSQSDTNKIPQVQKYMRYRTFVPGAAIDGPLEGATLAQRPIRFLVNQGPKRILRGLFSVLREREDQWVTWRGLLDTIGLKQTRNGIHYTNHSVYPIGRAWPNLVNTQFGVVFIANGRAADPIGELRWGAKQDVCGWDTPRARWGSFFHSYMWIRSHLGQRFDILQDDPLYMLYERDTRISGRLATNAESTRHFATRYHVLNLTDLNKKFGNQLRTVLEDLITVYARNVKTNDIATVYSGPYPVEYGVSLPDGNYEAWTVLQGQLWSQIISGKIFPFVIRGNSLDDLPVIVHADWSYYNGTIQLEWTLQNRYDYSDCVFELVFNPSLTHVIVPVSKSRTKYTYSIRSADTVSVVITPVLGSIRGIPLNLPINLNRPATPVQQIRESNTIYTG